MKGEKKRAAERGDFDRAAVDKVCKFIFLWYNNQNKANAFVTYIQPEKMGVYNLKRWGWVICVKKK